MPRITTTLTGLSLGLSFVISFAWFADTSGASRFEPVMAALGVIGAVVGIIAGQQAERRRQRTRTLRSLVAELDADAAVLADQRFAANPTGHSGPIVFPRLRLSAVDLGLSSGGVQALDDEDLLAKLHEWRDHVQEFNRRLEISEMRAFIVADPREIQAMTTALHREHGDLEMITRRLAALRLHLVDHYPEFGSSVPARGQRPTRWEHFASSADHRHPRSLDSS
jgi:hypothetical protein